jgi:hypothetical protein
MRSGTDLKSGSRHLNGRQQPGHIDIDDEGASELAFVDAVHELSRESAPRFHAHLQFCPASVAFRFSSGCADFQHTSV